MHDRAHIDQHSLIKGWNSASNEAFFYDNTVAENQGVQYAAQLQHDVLEFLFDTLWFSQVNSFDMNNCLIFRHVEHFSNLRVEIASIVLITNQENQLSDWLLQT